MPSQFNVRIVTIEQTLQLKITCFQVLRRTNVQLWQKKTFIILSLLGIAERSSLADISSESYHLIAFDLVNPLIYIYFPSFEYIIFLKILSLRCRRLLRCDFITSLMPSTFLNLQGKHLSPNLQQKNSSWYAYVTFIFATALALNSSNICIFSRWDQTNVQPYHFIPCFSTLK